jgi:MoxR-like ATPase
MTQIAKLPLNGKIVRLQAPYRPGIGADEDMVGRDREARMVLAAWLGQPGTPPMAPLLVGEPGLGKNRLVYELARWTRKDLYVFQGTEDVTAGELACSVRMSDDPERKLDYTLSALATAMLRGGICFIDEIGKLRHRALDLLVSVLDERRYLDADLLGERVFAQPGFRFVSATNPSDLAGGGLPGWISTRLQPKITMGFPTREEIDQIVRRRVGRINQQDGDGTKLIRHFWQLWRKRRGEAPPSPRDVLQLFGLALGLADSAGVSPELLLADDAPVPAATLTSAHVEAAFEQLFPVKG